MEDRPDWTPEARVLRSAQDHGYSPRRGDSLTIEVNGSAAPATERPNPLRREARMEMGDLYPGHQVLLRFNPNKKGIEPLPDDASDDEKVLASMKLIVRAHRVHFDDGTPDTPWIDPDTDEPLPSPSTNEFYEAISNEQLAIIAGHIAADAKKVRASATRIFGGSTDTSSDGSPPNATDPTGSAGTTS